MNPIRIFTYGTLKRGGHNHCVLSNYNAKYVADAKVHGTMYSCGGFPALSLLGNTDIKGEVFEVSEEGFAACDRLEGYPRHYDRVVVDTSVGPAWVYTQDQHADYLATLNVVRSGNWPVDPWVPDELAFADEAMLEG